MILISEYWDFWRNDVFKKKKETADDSAYTKAEYEAAVKKSICTGEMTFGFIRKADGHFVDIALVRNEEEMKALLPDTASGAVRSGKYTDFSLLSLYRLQSG